MIPPYTTSPSVPKTLSGAFKKARQLTITNRIFAPRIPVMAQYMPKYATVSASIPFFGARRSAIKTAARNPIPMSSP